RNETKAETEEEQKPDENKEPIDWFEPLEDDEDEDAKNPDEDSLAGESERSESVAGSEKGVKRIHKQSRRKPCRGNDEGWEDCPSLGEGWKRKETIRQSGTRSGQSDVYYMSPQGDRARSRIELSILMNRDLSSFEYKSGVFSKNGLQRLTLQRRKVQNFLKYEGWCCTSIFSDWQCLSLIDLCISINQSLFIERFSYTSASQSALTFKKTLKHSRPTDPPNIQLSQYTRTPTPPTLYSALTHRIKYIRLGTDDQGEETPSEGLSSPGAADRPRPIQWIPCGQCAGCHNKVNCGHCSNCKGLLPGSRKRTCRKRKCLCPIRKVKIIHSSFEVSFITPKRRRRACGECPACLRKDCGTCDFCIDKPKFGGSNKKDRKTLATFSVWGDADDATIWGRTKPQYTYSRKRKRVPPSEDEDEDKDQQTVSILYTCTFFLVSLLLQNITQIYSLADEPSDLNKEHDLMKMLDTLRSSALPILWYAIMVEGPQMQLVQCSKLSAMADTTVQIDTDFNYKISVQRHPLLPLHPLYDAHPSRLDSITHVVNLLLDMDKYIVCHGVPPTQAVLRRNPIILERAPTCEFLIKKNETICTNCRMLCE
uniref:CXXC-type domain-containing protein n=1 Tax=Neogobius melanostomus TaxID=47308 RepID=A0A8C6URM3_9GOBI